MTEYALILAAVAIVAYVSYTTLGGEIKSLMQQIVNDLSSSTSGSGS